MFVLSALVALVAWRWSERGVAASAPRSPSAAAPPASASTVLAHRAAFVTEAEANSRDEATPQTLEGQVIDAHEVPVEGAEIRLSPGDKVATSAADGGFAFPAVTRGRYIVVARRGDDYASTTARVTETSDPVILRMRQGVTLNVAVTDDGKPAVGATIAIDGRDAAITDTSATAHLHGVAPNYHLVSARAPGRAKSTLAIMVPEDPGGTMDIALALHPGAALAGTVLDPEGNPLHECTVTLIGSKGAGADSATCDPQGRWSFAAVAAGRFDLTASSEVFGAVEPVLVETDGHTARAGVVLRVGFAAQLVGTVVDAAKAPVVDARVRLRGLVGRTWFDATTDRAGRFQLLGFPPGTYDLTAIHGELSASPLRVSIDNLERVEVQVVLSASSIAGTVVDASGVPVDEATVVAEPEAGRFTVAPTTDVTDGKGRFDLGGLVAGAYTLRVTAPGEEPDPNAPGDSVTTGARDVRLVLPARAIITGRVVSGGRPVDAYALVVGSTPDQMLTTAPTGIRSPDGRFRKTGLRAGTYLISIVAQGTGRTTRTTSALRAGQTLDLGDIELPRGQRIRGRVVDASGAAVADATVSIGLPNMSSTMVEAPIVRAQRGESETRTDAAGRYVFEGAAPITTGMMTTQIWATHQGRGTSAMVPVPAGDATIDLQLLASGAIDGEVTHFDGGMDAVTAFGPSGDAHDGRVLPGGDFSIENLPAGDYTVLLPRMPEMPTAPPVTAHVVAGQRTHVTLALPTVVVRASVKVTGAPCEQLMAFSLAPGAEARPTGSPTAFVACAKGVATFEAIAPGTYAMCVDVHRCARLTIADRPAIQALQVDFAP